MAPHPPPPRAEAGIGESAGERRAAPGSRTSWDPWTAATMPPVSAASGTVGGRDPASRPRGRRRALRDLAPRAGGVCSTA